MRFDKIRFHLLIFYSIFGGNNMKTSITHSIKMLILVSTAFVFIVPKLSFAQYNINIAAHIVRDDNGNLGTVLISIYCNGLLFLHSFLILSLT